MDEYKFSTAAADIQKRLAEVGQSGIAQAFARYHEEREGQATVLDNSAAFLVARLQEETQRTDALADEVAGLRKVVEELKSPAVVNSPAPVEASNG